MCIQKRKERAVLLVSSAIALAKSSPAAEVQVQPHHKTEQQVGRQCRLRHQKVIVKLRFKPCLPRTFSAKSVARTAAPDPARLAKYIDLLAAHSGRSCPNLQAKRRALTLRVIAGCAFKWSAQEQNWRCGIGHQNPHSIAEMLAFPTPRQKLR